MVKASAVAKVLGGEKTLGKGVSSQQELIAAVRRGLRTSTVDAVIEGLDASRTDVLPTLRIARRTMERRKVTGRLLPEESERVYRLAKDSCPCRISPRDQGESAALVEYAQPGLRQRLPVLFAGIGSR